MSPRSPQRPWLGSVEMRTFLPSGQGHLTPIAEARPPRHWNPHQGGSVELVVNGRTLISREWWDDVENLWLLLAGLIGSLNQGWAYSTMSYPGQPIPVGLAHQADDMVVLIAGSGEDRRRAVADKHTLFEAFCRAGIEAFDHFERLGGGWHAATSRQALVDCLDGLYQGAWPSSRQHACTGSAREREMTQLFGVHRLAW
ncbi:hypothetical protein [Antribacter gilvus]|uniref:hypothetical protein n=1 Tax=Antribacter gilvus TaxID=2304675 RepID=UPI000F7AA448|nr:hypothetical protein [Antribacter gilvus]